MWPQLILIVVLTAILSFLLYGKFVNRKKKIPLEIRIQNNLDERIKARYSVGIIVGIIDKDETIYFSAGQPSKSSNQGMDKYTIFELGSLTKVFTSLLLARECQKGEVNLKDPISNWLPAEVEIPAKKKKQITLHHLANHSSGLPHLPDNFELKTIKNPYASYTKEQLYEFLKNYELPQAPGKLYTYSATGIGLLGHILSSRTQQTYAQLLAQEITQALEMDNTCIHLNKEQKKQLAQGYNSQLEPVPNWSYQVLEGAGAIYSNAQDLIQFLKAQMGSIDTPLKAAIKLSQKGKFRAKPTQMTVGLGWHKLKVMGKQIIMHDGLAGGYQSFIGFNLRANKAVVILSNSANPVDDLGLHILNEKFPLSTIKQEAKIAIKRLKKYVGTYHCSGLGDIQVGQMKKQLKIKIPHQRTVLIFPESKEWFFAKEANLRINFHMADNGRVNAMTIYKGSRKKKAKKTT